MAGSGRNNSKVTWAQAFRDIIIESMKKGQLPLLAFFLICGLFVWKTPETHIVKIWDEIFEVQRRIFWLSVVANLFMVLGWFMHARRQRREFEREYDRLVKERNALQTKLLGKPVESSNI